MRRLDLHPRKKLRNPARHLRQLALWPERIVASLPGDSLTADGRFWNFKVPVFAKLVEPPHATTETQRACIASIFAAAQAVENSAKRPEQCRVACLVTTPFMFESEVTLFFDEGYFRSFLPVVDKKRTALEGGWIEGEPADAGAIDDIVPSKPEGLGFFGGTILREFNAETGLMVERVNWVWAFERR